MVMEHEIPFFNRWALVAGSAAVLSLAAILSAAGCAARSGSGIGADEQIIALEKEVSRLKSERANLEARAGALDDKLLLMETKLKKCGSGSSTPGLSVVKLRPSEFTQSEEGGSDESAQEESEEFQDASDEKIATRKNKGRDKRPHLVLHQNMVGGESTFSDSMPLLNAEPAGNIEHPSAFDKFGADDLGVVSGGTTSGASPTSDEMTMFNNAYREYSNKRIDAALNQFAEFVKTYPNHAFADDALYWRGECFLTQGKFLYAIGELERLTRRYPASDKASSALFRIGFAYDKLRDYAKAAEYYFEVVGKFPGTEGARRASSRMAELKNSAASGGPLVPTSGTR